MSAATLTYIHLLCPEPPDIRLIGQVIVENYICIFKSFLKKLGTKAAVENKVSFDPADLEFKGEKIGIGDRMDLYKLYDLKGKDVFVEIFGEFSHVKGNSAESIVFVADNAYYIDLRLVSIEDLNAELKDIDFRIWGHDFKDTLFVMMSLGIEIKELAFDTSIAEYVIDVSKKDYSLKTVAIERLGYDPDNDEHAADSQMSMFRSSGSTET